MSCARCGCPSDFPLCWSCRKLRSLCWRSGRFLRKMEARLEMDEDDAPLAKEAKALADELLEESK